MEQAQQDILDILKSLNSKKTQTYTLAIVIGTIPAAIVGILFGDLFSAAYENIRVVATALLFTGIMLLATKFIKPRKNDVTIGSGFLIGLSQELAIIPGISRSGITISTGMFLGVTPDKAAKFSFLLAIPAIAGAGLLTALDVFDSETIGISFSIGFVGFLSSLTVGWISLKVLIGLIKTGKFYWFGVYCILIGLVSWII